MHTRTCPSLDHLDRLTDSTGLIQHGIYSLPRRDSGYTTDDNARALRLCVRLWGKLPDGRMLERVTRYLSFLEHARCPSGGFHNFMSYQREWLDETGTGDCQGQVVLALAEVLVSELPAGFRELALELLHGVVPVLAELRSLRAQAYVVQAETLLWRAGAGSFGPLQSPARRSADRLMDSFQRWHSPDWHWFESQMTYANAVLPHAMFDAADRWQDDRFLEIAEMSFAFLDQVTAVEDVFLPVGNLNWYSQGEQKSLYDQQPVEASTMAAAALAAFQQRGDQKYLTAFRRAHAWFVGSNSLESSIGDARSGACFDGLGPAGANRNQGAESTLAWLWTEMLRFELKQSQVASAETSFADLQPHR